MATQKFLDQNGLQTFWEKIKTTIANQVSTLQGNAVLKTGDHTMAGKLTANGGFAGNLTGNVTGNVTGNATSANKVNTSLTIKYDSAANGTTVTKTFNGQTATTIDLTGYTTDAALEAAVEALGAEIDARIASVTADGTLITATTSADKKVTIGPATKLTTAVGLAEAAVRSVTEGSTNGYIAVNTGGTTTGVKVHGINTAAYKAESYFVPATTYNSGINAAYAGVTANAGEIANIKNAIAGGTHFIGVKTALPSSAANGDICIVGNKEYIWDDSKTTSTSPNYKWVELGDTNPEQQRLTALETWKGTATTQIANVSTTATYAVGAAATASAKATNAQTTADKGVTAAANAQTTANKGVTAAAAAATAAYNAQTKADTVGANLASLSGTVNTLSGTVSTINNNYASKAAAVGSISSTATSPTAATAIAATGNITTWTITPKNVNGTALTTAKIEIESIPDSWINALS